MEQTVKNRLADLYPAPLIRGTRITRMEERELGRFALTAETARELGENNIGVFIGGCGDVDRTAERVRRIDASDVGGQWIVILATRASGAEVYQFWLDSVDVWYVDPRDVPRVWTSNKVTFCLPESLPELSTAIEREGIAVAGILLLDLDCMIHKARGFNVGDFRVRHDRPQLIANFRSGLVDDGWAPPLICLSQKPAKSVPTDSMRRAYCLETFHFVDGATLRCGRLPNQPARSPVPQAFGEPNTVVCAC